MEMSQKVCEDVPNSTSENHSWNLADYIVNVTKEKLRVKIWSSKKYQDLEFIPEGCRAFMKIGRGDIIVGFILCSLNFQSFRIGPIYGKNSDEIKDIVELAKIKVRERKFKNENPNLKKGHFIKSTEELQIRKTLPRDVVCYLDKFFSKKEAKDKSMRRKRTIQPQKIKNDVENASKQDFDNNIKNTEGSQDSTEVEKFQQLLELPIIFKPQRSSTPIRELEEQDSDSSVEIIESTSRKPLKILRKPPEVITLSDDDDENGKMSKNPQKTQTSTVNKERESSVITRSVTRDANEKFWSPNIRPMQQYWRNFRKNGEKLFEKAGNNIDPEYVKMIDNILSVYYPNPE